MLAKGIGAPIDGGGLTGHSPNAVVRGGVGAVVVKAIPPHHGELARRAYADRERQSQQQLANQRRDESLAILAHEMRSPLAPLRNALELMKQADTGAPVCAAVRGIMERQVDVLVRLVEDLMDISCGNLGQLELRRERVDLQSVVSRALEATQCAIDRAHHQLQIDLPSQPIILDADPLRLQQVLVNLVGNAVKYTDSGGALRLSARDTNGMIEIRIADNGIGIPPEQLENIFDLFNQGHRPKQHVGDGIGIGLALVRRLVTAHGGKVHALSHGRGMGSTFVVQLPRLT